MAKFHNNPSNLYTLLIRLKLGNKVRVLDREGKGKEKKSCGDLRRTKYPVNRARSEKLVRRHEFARVGFIFKCLPSAFIEQIFAFLRFLRPGFSRNFVQGVFSLFDDSVHNVRFHGFYIKKSLIPTA